MPGLSIDRGLSQDVARLAGVLGEGGAPTERRQDKSREVRGGRSGANVLSHSDLARCAARTHSLLAVTSHCKCRPFHTSCAFAP
jgi:hypothetical protein